MPFISILVFMEINRRHYFRSGLRITETYCLPCSTNWVFKLIGLRFAIKDPYHGSGGWSSLSEVRFQS